MRFTRSTLILLSTASFLATQSAAQTSDGVVTQVNQTGSLTAYSGLQSLIASARLTPGEIQALRLASGDLTVTKLQEELIQNLTTTYTFNIDGFNPNPGQVAAKEETLYVLRQARDNLGTAVDKLVQASNGIILEPELQQFVNKTRVFEVSADWDEELNSISIGFMDRVKMAQYGIGVDTLNSAGTLAALGKIVSPIDDVVEAAVATKAVTELAIKTGTVFNKTESIMQDIVEIFASLDGEDITLETVWKITALVEDLGDFTDGAITGADDAMSAFNNLTVGNRGLEELRNMQSQVFSPRALDTLKRSEAALMKKQLSNIGVIVGALSSRLPGAGDLIGFAASFGKMNFESSYNQEAYRIWMRNMELDYDVRAGTGYFSAFAQSGILREMGRVVPSDFDFNSLNLTPIDRSIRREAAVYQFTALSGNNLQSRQNAGRNNPIVLATPSIEATLPVETPFVATALDGRSIGANRFHHNVKIGLRGSHNYYYTKLGEQSDLTTNEKIDIPNLSGKEDVDVKDSTGLEQSSIEISAADFGKYNYTAMSGTDGRAYTTWGSSRGNQNRYWVLGQYTISDQIPKRGSATYNGEMIGTKTGHFRFYYHPITTGHVRYQSGPYGDVAGTIRVNVDFANQAVQGSWNMPELTFGTLENVIFNSDFQSPSFTANMSSTGTKIGNLDAYFYGPNAEEIGGTWRLDSSRAELNYTSAFGVFRAKSDVNSGEISNFSGYRMSVTGKSNGLPFGHRREWYEVGTPVAIETSNAGTTPISNTTTNASGRSLPTTDESFGVYSHIAWGSWNSTRTDLTNPINNNHEFWVIGARTPSGGTPKTGTATYQGDMVGASNTASSKRSVSGNIELTADFAANSIAGNYSLTGWGSGNIAKMDIIDDGVGAKFSNTQINGAFYGPTAEEVGGTWDLNGAAGIFRAKQ